jgi:hypothetical protein
VDLANDEGIKTLIKKIQTEKDHTNLSNLIDELHRVLDEKRDSVKPNAPVL